MAKDNQLAMLEKLFDAHIGPIREDIRWIKDTQEKKAQRIENMEKKIEAYENRIWGLAIGSGLGGGGFGALIMKLFGH